MRIIVGITGATGVQMGQRLLSVLRGFPDIEVHLVVSRGAELTLALESDITLSELCALADFVHDEGNLGASIASGSFRTDGMVILPCSMKTLAAIANGYDDNLVARAASVCLKEGRKLVLCPREMPLSVIQCRNLLACAEAGCAIIPPMLTFYSDYATVDAQVDHVIGKVLMQFGLDYDRFHAWQGATADAADAALASAKATMRAIGSTVECKVDSCFGAARGSGVRGEASFEGAIGQCSGVLAGSRPDNPIGFCEKEADVLSDSIVGVGSSPASVGYDMPGGGY